ncbi:SDR family NAD(P)-dependent oxidoreductase [Bacillus sp. DJP31]|uniref:SDR family NAD(P)-dependent oxidoreductase n=1 Tax=Bacillus sp. DJP31 TaxID=3409789 RepID=UPI003BB789B7
MKLNGKNIVITGASSGIGEKIAYKVAENGGTPILLARSVDKLKIISETIEEKYLVPCPFYQLNIQELDKVKETFRDILEEIGTVHVLVNNAGFGIFDHVADVNLEDMKAMFEVNVFGLIACTKAVLPGMLETNDGHIINIASQAGKIATPKSSVYSASKHAVLGFTNSLRMEVAETNIHVTAVNPGPIRTRFFDIADKSGTYVKSVERFMLGSDFVAQKIVDSMLTSKREINLPGWMNAGSTMFQLFPGLMEKIAGRAFFKK